MSIQIVVDDAELRRVQQQLGEFSEKAPNAIARALNRAVSNVKANLPKEATNSYHVKQSKVKEALKEFKANRSQLSAKVNIRGSVLGLNHFKVSPKTVNPKRKSQLKIATMKTGMKTIPGAFNANVNGVKVFTRTGKFSIATKGSHKGKKREEIERKMGPSVPQMIDDTETVDKINHQAWLTYERNLNHEVNQILRRI